MEIKRQHLALLIDAGKDVVSVTIASRGQRVQKIKPAGHRMIFLRPVVQSESPGKNSEFLPPFTSSGRTRNRQTDEQSDHQNDNRNLHVGLFLN